MKKSSINYTLNLITILTFFSLTAHSQDNHTRNNGSAQTTVITITSDNASGDQNQNQTSDIDFFIWDSNTRLSTPQGRIGLVGNGTANQASEASGRLAFYTTNVAHPSPTLSERMRINELGYVGIGVTNPDERLTIEDATDDQLGLTNSTGNSWQFRVGATGSLIFKDDGVERARFNSTGYLGIGTTSPAGKLQVHGETGEQSQGQIHIVGNGESGPGDAYISFYEGAESGSKWSMGAMDNNNSFSISHGLTMDAAPRLVINDATGNVGIGTTNPSSQLDIDMVTSNSSTSFLSLGSRFAFRGDGVLSWGSTANAGILSWDSGRAIVGANTGQELALYSNSSEKLRISLNGNVGIGTTTPSSKLEVDGTITSEEVKVQVVTPPDYVFAPEYQLRSLQETEAYIKANRHLPEIPSAKEMEANGVELGEMNMLLLKKIEELTLHLIRQQAEIDELKTKIKS